MKKLSGILALFIALNSIYPISPAYAENRCESLETSLVASIQVATSISDISSAGNQFRSCLSNYADSLREESLNSQGQIVNNAGAIFYSIFTAAATYNTGFTTSPNSRAIALKAAADYRMLIIGEESSVNPAAGSADCETPYSRLLAGALGLGDAALASWATQATRQCPLIRVNPRSTVSISTATVLVGQTLVANTLNWPTGQLAFQWLKDGNAITGETSERYQVRANDAGTRLSVRVTISFPGKISATKTSNLSQTVSLSTPQASPSPTGAPTPSPSSSIGSPPIPFISGSIRAGGLLEVFVESTPYWNLIGWDWLQNGQVIDSYRNKRNFIPNEKDTGSKFKVQARWSRIGSTELILTSPEVTVQAGQKIGLAQAEITSQGNVIKLTFTVWNSSVTLKKTWYRNGVALPENAGDQFKPSESDFGKKFYVDITGTQVGNLETTIRSNTLTWGKEDAQVSPGKPAPSVNCLPKLSGTFKVGSTIRVTSCNPPAGVFLSYEFFRDSTLLVKNTGSSRKLAKEDKGHEITVWAWYFNGKTNAYRKIVSKSYLVR